MSRSGLLRLQNIIDRLLPQRMIPPALMHHTHPTFAQSLLMSSGIYGSLFGPPGTISSLIKTIARVASAQDARDTARMILYFKEHHTTTLRQCDWNRVAFPAASLGLATWRHRTRIDLLRSLERLHRLYLDEQRLATQGQHTLTKWLHSGSNPT